MSRVPGRSQSMLHEMLWGPCLAGGRVLPPPFLLSGEGSYVVAS